MTSGGLGLTGGLGEDISQEELDFSDLFLYNSPGEDFPVGCDKDDSGPLLQNDNQPLLLVVDHHTAYISSSNQPVSTQDLSSHGTTTEPLSGAVFDSLGLASRPGTIPAPSPRIEITPSGDSLSSQTLQPSPGTKALGAYRECVSPASNLCPSLQGIHTSSTHSSPGASPRNSVTDETYLQPQHQHITSSIPHQRSRSASPHGKRSYGQADSCQGGTPVKQRSRSPSPIPSPHEQQGSYYLHQNQVHTEFQPQAQTSTPGVEEILSSLSSSLPRVMPSVARDAHGQVQRQDCVYGEGYDWAIKQDRMGRAGPEVKSETIYVLPAVWPPPHPVHHGAFGGLPVAPLPSLEWPLPSQSGQYELLIQQQPKSHHRAHYETEGSRGAVKTSNGGHPEIQLRGYQGTVPLGLQVFIGTADERLLKPHAFYQVHRITGKTVTTPSMERMMNGTKVLEIPLEPKNHMRVVIDCVGILKLRNADIELRNGETDIGRKNTRVRLVFPQRSAQEFPAVERQDLDRCSVLGGQQMVLTGQNFTSDSKVIFSEKTQTIKAEPLDDYHLNSYGYSDSQSLTGLSMKSLYHHLDQDSSLQALNISPTLYHLTTVDPRAHVLNPDPLDDQAVYYQPRVSTLINNPMLYHTANQHYSNCSTTLLGGSQMASHSASTPSHCVGPRAPMAKLGEGPQVADSFEACLMSRHESFVQTGLPLGKSPPSRYIHAQAQGKVGSRVEPGDQHLTHISSGRGNHEERASEKVTIKQENLRCAYLEDVFPSFAVFICPNVDVCVIITTERSEANPTLLDLSPPEVPEPTFLESLLRYGLFLGAIFQLICILAVIFPSSKGCEHEETESSDGKATEQMKKPKGPAPQIRQKPKKESKKKR
ncbi:Nuclear factor of activated T-cells [Nibea albiflora]|uniref:Nuclear factor of activated T-cells n=1 Tax=Nibea albiflora TaxID=240163 RepID=A0ACB7F0A6_NIBAL|nr:Nuclear factor of activated T-cells [Nibea albiflora]